MESSGASNVIRTTCPRFTAKSSVAAPRRSASLWEYAGRAGTQTKFYFGDDVLKACEFANTADYTFTQHHPTIGGVRCTDGYSETSPVGMFKPNAFGLYDMIGNAWEWVEDCWHPGYDDAPDDGSPWVSSGSCDKRVLRGQSFDFVNWGEGVAVRSSWDANGELPSIGFRIAREISP
jgi:formylglycine-generating enzyme required for sulfatase activity